MLSVTYYACIIDWSLSIVGCFEVLKFCKCLIFNFRDFVFMNGPSVWLTWANPMLGMLLPYNLVF